MSSMASNHAAFVGSVPENYDRYLGPVLFEPYAADLVERLDVPEEATVLELACGTGIVTRHLRDRLGPKTKLVATDLNEAMLSFAAQKFEDTESVEWKQADASELPFEDNTFDAVVCQFGVMFFPDKERALCETYRVLKSGGRFLFSVWDRIEKNDLAHTAHAIISKFFEDNPPDFYETPFSFHDPEIIRSMLRRAGFLDTRLSLLPLPAIGNSARALARGLVRGNPVIGAIKERDESSVPQIEARVAEAVAAQFGDAPVRARMQALICIAAR
jgi:ubiquinone/menaquinone biosynthesis C-methylase UbiE